MCVYRKARSKPGEISSWKIISENIFPVYSMLQLVSFALLLQGDFGTQKEAAWAISNLTISGRKDQVSSALIYFSKLIK